MTVHIFGAKSSPSCATFCLRQTAREFGKFYDPWLVNMVLNNFYVDDCLISVNATEDAITMVKNLRSLLAKGGFRLTKWLSTSHEVMKTIPVEEKSKSAQGNMPSVGVRQNVLGVSWDVITDEFYFNVDVSDARCTKRKMLSVTNSLYDPLGFVTPVVLKARFLFLLFFVLFAIFILHSRESELYRYTLDGKSALAWELPFSRFMGHLSST